jgi:pyrroline-5-carboxylate reductase
MQVGLIGSGQMATALARGWGDPVLCTDAIPERAQALADEVGGEALASNAELARRADLVVLCHKPKQLEEVATEIEPKAVASILAATPLSALRAAYPGVPVLRFIPSVTAAVGRGALAYAENDDVDRDLERGVLELFGRLGTVVPLPDALIDSAMALLSTSPAFYALVVEALVDAGVHEGLPSHVASELAIEALAGTAALLAAQGHDTLALRRAVTSPGGVTAKGLAALEAGGVRAALHDAVQAVVGR